jgi:hypothetical protein
MLTPVIDNSRRWKHCIRIAGECEGFVGEGERIRIDNEQGYFDGYLSECCNFVRQISETDREIDRRVYELDWGRGSEDNNRRL